MVILRLPDSRSKRNLEVLVFEERRKPEYPEKNLSDRSKVRIKNKLNPQMASTTGFEFGPNWWEASALITEPLLLPKKKDEEQTT